MRFLPLLILLSLTPACEAPEYGPDDGYTVYPQDAEQCEADPEAPWCVTDETNP